MLEQLKSTLRNLRCYHSANELENIVEISKSNDVSYLEFLENLFNEETKNRQRNRIKRNQKSANFPTIKTFDEFDFRFQTSITKREINE